MVIPKQDTFLCIADRSLSRLRGSPLTGAGCLGLSLAQAGLSGWLRQFKSLVLRRCVFPAGCCCGGYAAGARLGWLCALTWVGARPSSYVGAYILSGAAAAAMPPVRIWVGCAAWIWVGRWILLHLFPLYKQSPPLRGGCRRQPAGGGVIYAPAPPASLVLMRPVCKVASRHVRNKGIQNAEAFLLLFNININRQNTIYRL